MYKNANPVVVKGQCHILCGEALFIHSNVDGKIWLVLFWSVIFSHLLYSISFCLELKHLGSLHLVSCTAVIRPNSRFHLFHHMLHRVLKDSWPSEIRQDIIQFQIIIFSQFCYYVLLWSHDYIHCLTQRQNENYIKMCLNGEKTIIWKKELTKQCFLFFFFFFFLVKHHWQLFG